MQEEYRRLLNRINTSYEQNIGVIDADAFINGAIDSVFENIAIKFEGNTLVRNHLRQLEVKHKKIKTKKVDKDISRIDYPDNFYMLTRQFAKACKDGCTEEKVINLYMIQTSDLNQSLRDPNWKPSFAWEEALVEDAGNSLLIYHNCEFKIKEVQIDYLRKPKHIATPSLLKTGCDYVTSDGKTITSDINFEIDSTLLWRHIVRVAVGNTLVAMGDTSDYQANLANTMALDKIFLA